MVSPHLTQDLATHALFARLAIGHDTVARAQDRHPEPRANARDSVVSNVDATTRRGDSAHAVDHGSAIVSVAEHDRLGRIDPERRQPDARPSNNDLAVPFAVRAACVDDDNRSNEAPFSARPLVVAAGRYEGGVICPFTEDWFSLLVDAAGSVRITLDFDAAADLDLFVLDGNTGEQIGISATEDAPERVELDLDAPGLLIIGVDGFDDASAAYELSWELP